MAVDQPANWSTAKLRSLIEEGRGIQSSRCQAGPRYIRPGCPISPNDLLIINTAHIILMCVVLS